MGQQQYSCYKPNDWLGKVTTTIVKVTIMTNTLNTSQPPVHMMANIGIKVSRNLPQLHLLFVIINQQDLIKIWNAEPQRAVRMHVNAAVPDQIKGSALPRGCFHGNTIKRNPGWATSEASVWRCNMCELAWLGGLSLNGVWVHFFSAGAKRQMKERQAVLSRKTTPVTAEGSLHVFPLLILVCTLCRQGTL